MLEHFWTNEGQESKDFVAVVPMLCCIHVVRVQNAIMDSPLDCSHVTVSARQSPNIFANPLIRASCLDPSWASTRQPLRLGDPITMLNLNCYVRGDPRNCAFAVHINDDKTVSNLRDAIKEEIRPKFDDIPANELVRIPFPSIAT